jgi:hypothetical protein
MDGHQLSPYESLYRNVTYNVHMPPFMLMSTHSVAGPVLMTVVWLVQLLVAFLIYRDAKEQKMLAPVWAILGLLPMFGYLADLLYLLIREFRSFRVTEKPPATL